MACFACASSARPSPLTALAHYELRCAGAPRTAMLPPVLHYFLQLTEPIVLSHRALCTICSSCLLHRSGPPVHPDLKILLTSPRPPPIAVSLAPCVPSSRPSSLFPPSVGYGHGRFAGAADHPPGTAGARRWSLNHP